MDRFYQEKKEKGVEFPLPPTRQALGRRMARFVDPDGLAISVAEEVR